MTPQQKQFEADYLAAFPHSQPSRALMFAIWLQQAKRHEAELRAKVEAEAICRHYAEIMQAGVVAGRFLDGRLYGVEDVRAGTQLIIKPKPLSDRE